MKILALSAILLALISLPVQAAEEVKTPYGLYVIYDSSNSMWAELGDGSRKYEAGRKALNDFLAGDFEGRELAFRIYGHRSKTDCQDSDLAVPFSAPDQAKKSILKAVHGIKPTGKTPIDYSLRQALSDFGDRSGDIILITDGIESCNADPCALLKEWKGKNVSVNVHIVGLGLNVKEKEAMECMADAAGTKFTDAQSTSDLTKGLTAIKETVVAVEPEPVVPESDAKPIEKTKIADFTLKLEGNIDGKPHRGDGILTPVEASVNGGDPFAVTTNGRYRPPLGKYMLEAGIKTKSGKIYKPVKQEVTIEPDRTNKITLIVPMPPRVTAKFLMNGEPGDHGHVTAYQEEKEVFSFRGRDTVFVDEGSYTFRSSPNRANKDLEVPESFVSGEHKTITFELQKTVRVVFKFNAEGSDIQYRANSALYQNDQEKWSIHSSNGGDVTLGDYNLCFQTYIVKYCTPFTVASEPLKQIHEITVPSGYITVIYKDADGNEEKPKYLQIVPKDWSLGGKMITSNERVALVPGTYVLTGTPKGKGYGEQKITIKAGDEQTIVMQKTQ